MSNLWPALPLQEWQETCATLQLWTQIVGKVRMVHTPPVNHSWHVTLYVTARGLTTSPIPYGERVFQIDFDFLDHQVRVQTAEATVRLLPLCSMPVAQFYDDLMEILRSLDLSTTINTEPNELPDPIRFQDDRQHATYQPEYAHRFWQILVQSDRVFKKFRSRFVGKCSPVHFFWGSFDLAVTRFSGRPAPLHPGGVPHLPDAVVQEAYSQEVSSCGFWPGGGAVNEPAYYSYAYPEPAGFRDSPLQPAAAYYNTDLREFILPYEAVQLSSSPEDTLLTFLQSTYEAAANRANWDRAYLERER